MENTLFTVLVVALTIVLVPLIPRMVELRIRVLRWMGLNRLARFHERAFGTIVFVVRCVLVALCLFVAIRGSVLVR